jgi:hypothetical protein
MTDPFCPEAGPSGALCGVLARITHSEHFARDGSTWTTGRVHSAPVVQPADWLWDKLGIDPDRISRTEFGVLLRGYLRRMNQQASAPPQVLIPTIQGKVGRVPMMLRPCICCRCTGTTMCWHADEGGCHWGGPGR